MIPLMKRKKSPPLVGESRQCSSGTTHPKRLQPGKGYAELEAKQGDYPVGPWRVQDYGAPWRRGLAADLQTMVGAGQHVTL